MQTLRRSGNWLALLRLVDLPRSELIRPIALRAIADQAEADVVDGLIARLDVQPENVNNEQKRMPQRGAANTPLR